jgi:MoaA/NifB/PqqE/SkfB family radical SAM enzyme
MRPEDIKVLTIEATSYCNAKCPHCPRFDTQGNLHPDLTLEHLNFDLIQSNLQLDKLTNLKIVRLEGDKGDPMMHPDIEKIIDVLSRAPSGPVVNVVTNGSIRSPAWWQSSAKKFPKLHVTFSIDGLEDTNHLYRVGLDFNKIINNAKSFIDHGGNATWKFILFKHNEHQIDDIIQLSQQLGFAELEITSCRTGDFQNLTDWPVIVNNKVSHFLQQPTNRIHKKIVHDTAKSLLRLDNFGNDFDRICPWMVAGKLYITYLNELIPCCMMHFDTKNNYFGKTRLIEMTGGIDNQDLTKHSISTILGNKFFDHELKDSLTTGKWHINCARSCKSQILNNIKKHV